MIGEKGGTFLVVDRTDRFHEKASARFLNFSITQLFELYQNKS